MKLRIRGNSIRLRLGESEVARLARDGRVSESTQFGAQPSDLLTYSIEIKKGNHPVSAQLGGGTITVLVPEGMAREWATSRQVGISHLQPIGDGAMLSILIEKDFRCLEPRPEEEQSDTFPNPGQHGDCDPS